jgi:hypothetical protein
MKSRLGKKQNELLISFPGGKFFRQEIKDEKVI